MHQGKENGGNAGMGVEPVVNRRALVAGEIVGDEVEISGRIGLLDRREQAQLAGSGARPRRERQLVLIAHPHRARHPDLLPTPTVFQRGFDPLAIG
jgi:hypothetical protein